MVIRFFGQCDFPVAVCTLVLQICRMWRPNITTVLSHFLIFCWPCISIYLS